MEVLEMDKEIRDVTVKVGPEECLKGLLWNDERWYLDALKRMFPKKREEQYAVLVGYIAKEEKDVYDYAGNMLMAVGTRTPSVELVQIKSIRKHLVSVLLKGKAELLAKYLDSVEGCMIHLRWKDETVWISRRFTELLEVTDVFWKTHSDLKYGLTFGGEHILRDLDEKSLFVSEVEYPVFLERQIGIAVGKCNRQEYLEQAEKFFCHMIRGVFSPEDIRYAFCKLLQYIYDIVKDLNADAYYELKSQNMAERILSANCRQQLYEILIEAGEIVCGEQDDKRISNYNINRALEYIRLHYNEGITLEETARALRITPEYLSMLFKREVGINFSVFLKRFRISHAKRLLKGTDMKVREVAAACGYSNSNYFIKVFREVTGTVPTDFR